MSRGWELLGGVVAATVMAAGLSAASPAAAVDAVSATIPTGESRVVVVSPDGSRAYVLGNVGATLKAVDVAARTTLGPAVSLPSTGRALAITPDGSRLLVTAADNTVLYYDTATMSSTGTPVPVGANPSSISLTADGSRAYVGNMGGNSVSVFDVGTRSVLTPITVTGTPEDVAVTPDGTRLVVANAANSRVQLYDTATGLLLGAISPGFAPTSVVVDREGRRAYAVAESTVVTIDVATVTEVPGTRVSLPGNARFLAITPDGRRLYATRQLSVGGTITPIDTGTHEILPGPPPLDNNPGRLAFLPDIAAALVPRQVGTTVLAIGSYAPTIASATVSGSAVPGGTQSVNHGSLTGAPYPPAVSYRWQSAPAAAGPFADIPGATAATFAVTTAVSGSWVRAVATATTPAGSAEAVSAAVGPVPIAPTASMTGPTSAVSLASAVRVSWTGRDPDSAISSYRLQRASKTAAGRLGGYVDVGVPPTATSMMATVRAGDSACFRVQATDPTGLVSPWSEPRCVSTPVDDRGLVVGRNSGWVRATSRTAYLRTLSVSRIRGATLTLLRATGRGLVVVVTKQPGGATLGVYVGNRRVGQVVTAARRVTPRAMVTVRVPVSNRPVVLRIDAPGRGAVVDGVAVLG